MSAPSQTQTSPLAENVASVGQLVGFISLSAAPSEA